MFPWIEPQERSACELPKQIKVLYVVRPVSGGIRQHLNGLWQNLDHRLVKPFIVCPESEARVFHRENPGLSIFPLDIRGNISPWQDLKVSTTLLRLAESLGVELIHAHSYKAGLLTLCAGLNKHRSYRLLCTFHNPLRRFTNHLHDVISRLLASRIGYVSDHLITISNSIRDDTINLLRVPENKVTCIYNGIDPSVYHINFDSGELRREWGIPDGVPLIGTIARLIPQKGIQYLIQAATIIKKKFSDFRILVVGDGPFRRELEELSVSAGVSGKIIFTGFRSDIPRILAAIELFVLPTLEEGMSVAILEAMCAGKPVIASRIGGVPEVVTRETGILVHPGDSGELANAIDYLLSDAKARERMGKAGCQQIEQNFTLQKMAKAHYQLYYRLVTS